MPYKYDDDDNYVGDDYSYVGSTGIYKRIARLTDYADIVKAVETATVEMSKYDINCTERGLNLTITISPKAVTDPTLGSVWPKR